MLLYLRAWLDQTALDDPLERGYAVALQIVLLVLLALSSLLLTLTTLLLATQGAQNILAFLTTAALVVAVVSALRLVRRGQFTLSMLIITLGFIGANTLTLAGSGLRNGSIVLLLYLFPLLLAGLIASQRILTLNVALIVLAIVVIEVLERSGSPLVGFAPPPAVIDPSIGPPFALVVVLIAGCCTIFNGTLRKSLLQALTREREITEIRTTLETTVATRTEDLRSALTEVEARAAEQTRLLAENDAQQVIIRALHVPVIPVNHTTLIIPLVGAMDAERLQNLQAIALESIEQRKTKHLLLDVTGVPTIDSAVAIGLVAVARSARLMGTNTVIIGIRPEVAQTIVGLGLDLRGLYTASDLQSAVAMNP